MKKIMNPILTAVIVLSLTACKAMPEKEMHIEKAQLSEQEEAIANLLGADNSQVIFDFALDENVKSLQVNTYELIDGAWKIVSGGGRAFSDPKGRLALDFENIVESLRIAIQSEHENGATRYTTEPIEASAGTSRATSTLNNRMEIAYEQEIPLVIQISTSQNEIISYDVETFFTPEQYEKQNYEQVYAVTLRFSQKTVGELSNE